MADQPNPAQPNPAAPPPEPDPAIGAAGAGDGPAGTSDPGNLAGPGDTSNLASIGSGPTWTEPSLPAVEPAEETAPAQAVARDGGTSGEPASPRRSSGLRWAIALGGIAIVIGISLAILALASGRPTPSVALGYMPDNTLQYGEYRLDLPGDQRQKLAAFLSKFPGFADQAAIQPKLYEVFDRIVALASKNSQTFTTDIEPWFGGQIAMGNGAIDPGALSGDLSGNSSFITGTGNALFVVTIKDAAKATAWLEKTLGGSPVTSSYGDARLYASNGIVVAVTDKVLLGGTEPAVKAAIDTKGQGNLASDPEFKAAFGSVSRDYVAFSFMDYRSYVTSLVNLTAPSAGVERTTIDTLLGLVPAWVATDFRFEDDALVGDGAYPSVDIGYTAKNRASSLAGHAPPSTIFYGEAHDVGAASKAFLDKLRAIPELSSTFGQIDQSAGLIGGLDGLIGWWGDTAVVIGPDGNGSFSGGLLIAPTDAEAAKKTFATLRSFVVLGGGQAGIQMRDEKHGDATVTIIDFSAAMVAQGGVPPGVKAELAYTVTDDIVAIGYGAAFVNAVLDAGPGPSLAEDARYKALVDRVGAENIGLSFIDIQAIRGLAEPFAKGLVSADQWATYEKEYLPYVKPLDALISGARVDGGINRLPMSFTVK